jgi:AraC family transcriptional regulator of arabinose operon
VQQSHGASPAPVGRAPDPAESYTPTVDRVLAGAFVEGPGYAVWRSRGTTDWLIIHTVGGQGRFGPATAPVLTVAAGDLVLLRPGTAHDYGTAPRSPRWDLQFAHFHPRPDWIALLDWPEPSPGVRRLRTTGEVRRRVTECFTRTVVVSRSGLSQAQLFGLNALETALLWAATQKPDTPHLDPRLIAVLEEISVRLAEPLSVRALAVRAGLSESRLTHLFVAQLGTPPMRFVEQQRMRAAEQLLDLSPRSVAAVARAVGYEDPLYFSARFKRFTGRSPSAYRDRQASSGSDPEARHRQPQSVTRAASSGGAGTEKSAPTAPRM